jgi:hypothetical protein
MIYEIYDIYEIYEIYEIQLYRAYMVIYIYSFSKYTPLKISIRTADETDKILHR